MRRLRSLVGASAFVGVAVLTCAVASPVRASDEHAAIEGVRVQRRTLAPAELERWRALREERPVLRAFGADATTFAFGPLPEVDDGWSDVRASVARELATAGLLRTTVRALAAFAPEQRADARAGLLAVGLPLDWLACFRTRSGDDVVDWLLAQLAAGRMPQELDGELAACTFTFTPTIAGWRVASESGEHAPAALRVQLSSSSDYAAPGEGGALDLVRLLARELPDARQVISVEEKHLAGLLAWARTVPARERAQLDVLVEPLPVAQWAQDNAKSGIAVVDGRARVVSLVPRYASRGEDGTTFVPSETLLLGSLALAELELARSPLLFQGGNLLVVRDPRSGSPQMLVGEAEILRNTALGLTRDQVLTAMRAEFGVDRCIVLPAVSFHIDMELTVRATSRGLIAFVSDTSRATRLALRCGIEALERAKVLEPEDARIALGHLDAGRIEVFSQGVQTLVGARADRHGRITESFAAAFSAGPTDSGVGNLQRFLLALDALTAERITGVDPATLEIDAHAALYLESFARRERDRLAVAHALEGLGWTLVPVPSTSELDRSLNTLNGLQLPDRYLMPATGGIFEPFDRAASEAFRAALPDVRIVPIGCAETQRRAGALHCAIAVVPRVTDEASGR